MRALFFILLVSCTNIQIKETKVAHSHESQKEEKFEYQVEDISVKNGKVKFVRFETNLDNGLYEINCLNGKSVKSTYKVSVQEKYAHSYIAESYFSGPHSKKCFLKGEHVLNINVGAYPYKKEKLNVAKGKVDLSKKDLERVIREKEIKKNIYKNSADTFLFDSSFDIPLTSYITSHYGNIRLFNNKKRSQHLGNDFRAAVGVPIPSANRGRVVYTGDLFFSGKLVVIDHGLDIFTLYGHLSKIKVKKGDMVNKGDIVGLAGRTGRVSGPHLHWGVKMGGSNIDGFSLVQESKEQFKSHEVGK